MGCERKTAHGSITIFASISIMLVAGFLLALAEAGRVCEIRKLCRMDAEAAIESVFAQYTVPLWENYHMLSFAAASDGGFGTLEQDVVDRSARSLCAFSYGRNYLMAQPIDAEFTEYALLIDDQGAAFYEAAASYMKNNWLEESFKEIYNLYEATQEIVEDYEEHDDAIEQAKLALATAEEGDGTGVDHTKAIKPEMDPFVIEQLLTNDNLCVWVLEDPYAVSAKRIEEKEAISYRYYEGQALPKGTKKETYETDFLKEMLVNQYIISQFSSYANVMDGRALDYEVEHILAGCMSDVECLDEVMYEILFIREAVNFAYIITDSKKLETAEGVATYIAGITENEFIIQAVKWGLVGLWVYVESLLDLRALFAGDHLLPIKTSEYWASDLTNLSECIDAGFRTKDCEYGLGYQQFLRILLLSKLKTSIAYRSLDVMQATVRSCKGYENYCIDAAVIQTNLTIRYQYTTVFLGMDAFTAGHKGNYVCSQKVSYSYLNSE